MTQVRPREAQRIFEAAVARYQMYPAYRDSGVAWLGEIPANWQIIRLKYVCQFLYGESLSSENRQEGEIPVYGSNGIVGSHSDANTKSPVIVVGRKGSYGKINYSEAPIFAIDTTYYIDPTATKHNLRWVFYLLQILELDTLSKDSAVPGLSREDAHNKYLPVPPPDEQRAIATFLDRQTAKIDALIAKKRELIAALHEKRSAIISHAVTKGLNPDVPMKDSGIEWLGEIPAGWRVVKIKYLAQLGNGSTPLRDNEEYWHEGTFPWITSTFVNDDAVGEPTQFVTERALRECHLPIVRPQSVLVAITGQGKTRGMAAVLHYEATINQHLVYISPRSDLLLSDFLHLFLSSVYDILRIISEGAGSTRGALTVEQIANFAVFLPPVSEQWDIVKYISEHTAEIDAMTAKITETIERLQEYRSALISAAVTGKIDVRGEAGVS